MGIRSHAVWGFAVWLIAAVPAQAESRSWDVLFQGEVAGQLTVAGDGRALDAAYRYRDNGRGPDYREEIGLDAAGAIVAYRIEGQSTYGAPVAESYVQRDGQALWHSQVDDGSREVEGDVGYLPLESSPLVLALLARHAARRADATGLTLLPSGRLQVERLRRIEVDGEALALWRLQGLDFAPNYLWLRDDASQDFAALIVPGYMSVLPSDRHAWAEPLEAAQQQAEAAWLDGLAENLRHTLPGPILIRDARVFDTESGEIGPPQDVYVHGGRIAALRDAGSDAREPGTVIEAAGRTLLPGLYDMHVHVDAQSAPLHLAAGVTTVRDMGNDNATLAALQADSEAGRRLAPHIVPSGFIEGRSAYSARGGHVVDSLDAALAAAEWYAQRGIRQLKLYNSFAPEWVGPLADAAHARGQRIAGHVPAGMRAADAVAAGYDELTHINQVMLNFLLRPEDDPRTLARFYRIMEDAHALDLDAPEVTAFIAELAERGIAVDATLAVFEDMYQPQGVTHPSYAAVAEHLPATVARAMKKSSFDVTDDNAARYRASFERMGEFVARLHAAGVPLVAGTDALPGFTLHRELELYAAYGIPAAEVLRIATAGGAVRTGRAAHSGRIAPGYDADLVLIDGDPLADIGAIRRPVLTMKAGAVLYPHEIHAALGIEPFAQAPSVTVLAREPAGTPPASGGAHRHRH